MATANVILAPGTPAMEPVFTGASMTAPIQTLKRAYDDYASPEREFEVKSNKNILFDPKEHLAYKAPSKVHMMEDIDLPAKLGVSPVAISEPFQLFSPEAIDIMRSEVLSKEVNDKYAYTSDITPKQLRGFAPTYAKFVYEAWKNPETLDIISKIAGIDLVPVIDYEVGHTNIAVPGKVSEHKSTDLIDEDTERPVVDWHHDSYPFVCVLMMSDTTGMIGGETAIRTGSGEIKKVRGPTKGCAVVLQGRYIEHQALRAFGSQERITMVTSFRPRSPFVRDDTILATVRPVSGLSDLYGQVAEYQLENMETRVRHMLKTVRQSMKAGATDVKAIKAFLDFEIANLTHIQEEFVEEDKVQMGSLREIVQADIAKTRLKRQKMMLEQQQQQQ